MEKHLNLVQENHEQAIQIIQLTEQKTGVEGQDSLRFQRIRRGFDQQWRQTAKRFPLKMLGDSPSQLNYPVYGLIRFWD